MSPFFVSLRMILNRVKMNLFLYQSNYFSIFEILI